MGSLPTTFLKPMEKPCVIMHAPSNLAAYPSTKFKLFPRPITHLQSGSYFLQKSLSAAYPQMFIAAFFAPPSTPSPPSGCCCVVMSDCVRYAAPYGVRISIALIVECKPDAQREFYDQGNLIGASNANENCIIHLCNKCYVSLNICSCRNWLQE